MSVLISKLLYIFYRLAPLIMWLFETNSFSSSIFHAHEFTCHKIIPKRKRKNVLIILCTCTSEITYYQTRELEVWLDCFRLRSRQRIAAFDINGFRSFSQFILWATAIIKRASRVNLRRNSHLVFYEHIHKLSPQQCTLRCFTISFVWVWNILSLQPTPASAIWYRRFFFL